MRKRTSILLGLLATAIVGPFIFESCQSEMPETNQQALSNTFFASIKANESSFLNTEIVVQPTRSAAEP